MKNVLEFIEGSAAKYPDKLAVADVNGGLTYKELEKTAKQVGAWLYQGLGGCKNRPVVVLLDKEPKSVAAFMGVVYSGNFYVVIDVEMPVDRVNKILKALKPEAAITDNKHLLRQRTARAMHQRFSIWMRWIRKQTRVVWQR